jgi:hypothetical protein
MVIISTTAAATQTTTQQTTTTRFFSSADWTSLKRKGETSKMLRLEHSFIWY